MSASIVNTLIQTISEVLVDSLPNDALVFFSEEAHFHLSGCVNKQNMGCWSERNPRELHERSLHSDRVTVWCAISRVAIIGPYLLQENGRTLTVNSYHYLTMIQDFFFFFFFFSCSQRSGIGQCVVSARWGHSPHRQDFNGFFERSLPQARDLPERGCKLACALARFSPL